MTLYLEPDPQRRVQLAATLAGEAHAVADRAGLAKALRADPEEHLVVLGPGVPMDEAVEISAKYRASRPELGVVLVRDSVDVAVLGAALRAGIREVFDVADADAIRAGTARSLALSRELAAAARPANDTVPTGGGRPGVLVTVFAGKGGCGKSMTATNLAVALTHRGRSRVCLVDLDLVFGDIAAMLRQVPKRSIVDAVAMAGRLDESAIRSLVTSAGGIDTLLAPPRPADADLIGRDLVAEVLDVVRGMYDYVVVDTPASFSDHVLAALDRSTWHVLVATPDIPALRSLRLVLDMFELLEYPADRRVVVLNRADALAGLTASDIDRVLRVPIAVRIPSTREVPVSINQGIPLMVDQPGNPVSRCVRQFVDDRISPRDGDPGVRPAPARRAFSLRRPRVAS
jgi:pilus assembly protein CpaE